MINGFLNNKQTQEVSVYKSLNKTIFLIKSKTIQIEKSAFTEWHHMAATDIYGFYPTRISVPIFLLTFQ